MLSLDCASFHVFGCPPELITVIQQWLHGTPIELQHRGDFVRCAQLVVFDNAAFGTLS